MNTEQKSLRFCEYLGLKDQYGVLVSTHSIRPKLFIGLLDIDVKQAAKIISNNLSQKYEYIKEDRSYNFNFHGLGTIVLWQENNYDKIAFYP